MQTRDPKAQKKSLNEKKIVEKKLKLYRKIAENYSTLKHRLKIFSLLCNSFKICWGGKWKKKEFAL